MIRKSRLAQKKSRNNVIIGLAFIALVIAVLAGVIWWDSVRPAPLDSQTLCPLSGPLGHQILLVDRTDPFNEAQKSAFDNAVKDLVESLPVGHLFSVFVLGDDFKAQTKPLLDLCNPGDGQGKSGLTENIKALRTQYVNNFTQPLRSVTTELLSINSAKESPIIEMLQLVYLNSVQVHKVKGPINLYILSDMMQFSAAMDMYKSPPNFEKYDATYAAKKLWVNLEGIDVHVILLNNNIKNQSPAFMEFWNSYFKRANVKSLEVTSLPG